MTRFSVGVVAGSLVLIFGMFGAWHSHSARATRAQQAVVGAGFKPALTRSAMPAAKGISSLPLEAQASISRSIGADLPAYQVRMAGADPAGSAVFDTRNARNKLTADFTAQGVVVHSGNARWKMALAGYGYGDDLHSVAAMAPTANVNRVEYRRGALTEWYVNGPMGLEQGFTFAQPPQSGHRALDSFTLTLALTLSGDVTANADRAGKDVRAGLKPAPTTGDLATKMDANGKGLILTGPPPSASPNASPRPSLRYAGLTATDAGGKELPASLELRGQELLLKVNDAGARYPVVVDPFVQLAELTGSDEVPDDELGYSTAISGNTVVVGAPAYATGPGAVYVFVEPASGWANMTQTAELTASDAEYDEGLGRSVAISGNTVVAGAPNATIGSNTGQGAAYVFVEPPTGWTNMTETAKLTASDGAQNDGLGYSVATDGKTIVAGAPYTEGSERGTMAGTAYVFVEPANGWMNMTQRAELTCTQDGIGEGDLGYSVAISGNTIVAGAPGIVFVYVESAGGWNNMTQTAQLTAPNLGGSFLGGSVAISGNIIVAGAPDTNTRQVEQGAVCVFVKPAGGWTTTSICNALLTASVPEHYAYLGSDVAFNGNTIVAEAPGWDDNQGTVYIFIKPASGWKGRLTQASQITIAGSLQFGLSVAVSGNTIVAGSPNTDVGGTAYVFGQSQ